MVRIKTPNNFRSWVSPASLTHLNVDCIDGYFIMDFGDVWNFRFILIAGHHIIFKPYLLTPAKIMCWAGKWDATLRLDLIWDGSIPTWFTLIRFAPTLLFYITSLSSFFFASFFLLSFTINGIWPFFLLVRITRSVRCTTLHPTNVKMFAIMVQFHLTAW